MTYESEVLADAPFIYWRLGEPSGTTATDDSGNGNDGTYVGGPTLGATGLLVGDADTAVTFPSGTGVWTESAAVIGPTTLSGFSIELLMDISAPFQKSIITVEDPAQVASDFVELYTTGGNLWFDFRGTSSYSPSAGGSATPVGTHHIVGTFDGSAVNLYIDGSLSDTQAFSDAGALFTVANSFYVGGALLPAAGSDGTLDEAAFYTTALSPTRIAAHYAAATGTSPPPPTPSNITILTETGLALLTETEMALRTG